MSSFEVFQFQNLVLLFMIRDWFLLRDSAFWGINLTKGFTLFEKKRMIENLKDPAIQRD